MPVKFFKDLSDSRVVGCDISISKEEDILILRDAMARGVLGEISAIDVEKLALSNNNPDLLHNFLSEIKFKRLRIDTRLMWRYCQIT